MIDDNNIEITAKLKLDTEEAEAQLKGLSSNVKAPQPAASPQAVELPKGTKDSLKNLFSGDGGLKNIANIAQGATQGVNGLLGALRGVAGASGAAAIALAAVAAAVMLIMKLLQGTDTLKAITEKVEHLFDVLQEIVAPTLSALGDTWMALIQIVEDLLPLLKPLVSGLAGVQKILTFVLKLIEPIIKLIGQAFDALWGIIVKFVKAISFGLIDLDAGGSTTGLKSGKYKSSLDTWATSGKSAEDKLSDASDGLKSTAEKMSDAWEGFKSAYAGVWDDFKQNAKDCWNSVKGFASKAWTDIKDIAVGFWNGLKGFFKGIGDFGEDVWEGAVDVATGAWEGVKRVASDVGGWIADTASTVWGAVAGGADKAWNWVKGLFKADGGTLGQGAQIWGMNEQGNPEFLFNAGGHDTVINADILAEAVASGVKRAQGSGFSRIEVSVKEGVSAGPRELAQWLLPALKFSLKS